MALASSSLPMAGDYLVSTFAEMMHAPRFRAHVWARMPLAERHRLEALRLQALYGDAPITPAVSGGASPTASATAAPHPDAAVAAATDGSSSAPAPRSPTDAAPRVAAVGGESTPPPSSPSPPSPPRWFDIAGRARFSAWAALRGRMSADVAAECFCSEFLGLIKRHPHPTLLPLVEAALSTAHGLAQRGRVRPAPSSSPAPQPRGASTAAAASVVPRVALHVRALQGDPAALALLWICRAYRLPCEFTIEPLSKALGTRQRRAAPATARSGADANPYMPYTLADACYPFSAAVTLPMTTVAVSTPEAAFLLLADTLLAGYPHWLGTSPSSSSSSSVQRCVMVDELQHITRHVRTPILALLVHQATQPPSQDSVVAAAERRLLLRAVAAHLHTYERRVMDGVLSRRIQNAHRVLAPVLASTAVVDALQQAFAPDARAVSVADAYVSCCGYALCTHPFCADVFPHLRVPPLPAAALPDAVHGQWPAVERSGSSSSSSGAAAAAASAYVPWALPLYLSGVPAVHNDIINRVLRREAAGAMRLEQQQQPRRAVIDDEGAAPVRDTRSSGGVPKGDHAPPPHTVSRAPPPPLQQQEQVRRAGYYAIGASCLAREAAEAVGQLIMARMSSLQADDLDSDAAAVGSTSSVSGEPFLVLRHVFALTWALAQEQVAAFPFFMVDGNPAHHGGLSFLTTTTTTATTAADLRATLAPARTTADGGVLLLPAAVAGTSASSQDGGVSLESRLRCGWHASRDVLAKVSARLPGTRRSNDEPAIGGVHATVVLRSGGDAGGAVSSRPASAPPVSSRL